MSSNTQQTNNLKIAHKAERDLNSVASVEGHDASISRRHGHGASDSTTESGVDEAVTVKFPDSSVSYGSSASAAGDNREIPLDEGGSLDPKTGKPYKAKAFEGAGGPEDKERLHAEMHGGDNDVRGNINQVGESRR